MSRKTSKALLRAVQCTAILLSLTLLSACTYIVQLRSGWTLIAEDDAQLTSDVLMALYVSPQSHDWGAPGYVLLVTDSGQISAIRTAGMDVAALHWDDQGLFFSDVERDYLLTESGLTTWDSPKTDLQVGVWAKPDHSGWVSVYNVGFGGGGQFGYIEQVVETTTSGVTRYDAPGFSTLTAQCDDRIFSVAEIDKPFQQQGQQMGAMERSVAPYWPDGLIEIYPMPGRWTDGLTSVRLDGYGGYAFRATCREETILSVTGGQNQAPMVVTWPTDGGTPEAYTIVGLDGEALGLDTQVALFATSADWSSSPDELVWMGGDGLVRSTNIQSGRSADLWDSGTDFRHWSYNTVVFNDSTVYVLDMVGEPDDNPSMRLRAHDLASGVTRDLMGFRLNINKAGSTLVTRGMAIRPGG